jgi:hypothetical protein
VKKPFSEILSPTAHYSEIDKPFAFSNVFEHILRIFVSVAVLGLLFIDFLIHRKDGLHSSYTTVPTAIQFRTDIGRILGLIRFCTGLIICMPHPLNTKVLGG